MKNILKAIIIAGIAIMAVALVSCKTHDVDPYVAGKGSGYVLHKIYDHPSTSAEARAALAAAWEILDHANPDEQFQEVQERVNKAVELLPSGIREKAQKKVAYIFGDVGQLMEEKEVEAALQYLKGVKEAVKAASIPAQEAEQE